MATIVLFAKSKNILEIKCEIFKLHLWTYKILKIHNLSKSRYIFNDIDVIKIFLDN